MANSRTRSRSEAPPGFAGQAVPPGDHVPFSESDFLNQLGGRVRSMRQLCDMSRRELARRSGISERCIAQIEAGKGNVSIVLLLRIAFAVRRG